MMMMIIRQLYQCYVGHYVLSATTFLNLAALHFSGHCPLLYPLIIFINSVLVYLGAELMASYKTSIYTRIIIRMIL